MIEFQISCSYILEMTLFHKGNLEFSIHVHASFMYEFPLLHICPQQIHVRIYFRLYAIQNIPSIIFSLNESQLIYVMLK
jgi:hypothetical protein